MSSAASARLTKSTSADFFFNRRILLPPCSPPKPPPETPPRGTPGRWKEAFPCNPRNARNQGTTQSRRSRTGPAGAIESAWPHGMLEPGSLQRDPRRRALDIHERVLRTRRLVSPLRSSTARRRAPRRMTWLKDPVSRVPRASGGETAPRADVRRRASRRGPVRRRGGAQRTTGSCTRSLCPENGTLASIRISGSGAPSSIQRTP